jgi:hypothetical protein
MKSFREVLEEIEPINEYEIFDTILKIKQGFVEYYIDFSSNDYNGQIVHIYNNCLSDHTIRLLKLRGFEKISKSNIFDLFLIFDTIDFLSSCTICGQKIHSYGKIGCCSTVNCKSKFVELVTDDTVIECYTTDKITFNLLILTAYACLKHPQREYIFDPFPPNFKSLEEIDKKLKYGHTNVKILFDIMKCIKSDYELLEKIGANDYSFLKFIISSNITNLRSDLLFNDNKNIFDQKNIENIFDHDDVITFKVDQDPLTNKRFEGIKQNYLFSGSCLSNWYSILRNGMKVYSGTKMQLHGAARGKGIYLSDTMNTSVSYGADKFCKSDLCVFGIFQVLYDKQKYFTGSTIFVVPNENELVLRYIIVLRNSSNVLKNNSLIAKINEYFMVHKEKEVNKAYTNYNSIRIKRIMYDIAKITKVCEKEGWDIIYDIKSFNKIEITGKNTKISVLYSEDYPSEPPHLMITETSRKINNSDILNYGGIMNRKLSYKFWETGTEIHKIIKNVIQNVTDIVIPCVVYDVQKSLEECTKISKLMV